MGLQVPVPLATPYSVPLYVENISTPGVAISIAGPKLLKLAKESSCPMNVGRPIPPHLPSLSLIADTVITEGLEDGE